MEHPTPWKLKENGSQLILIDSNGYWITGMSKCVSQKEAANTIVRAVNAEQAHRNLLEVVNLVGIADSHYYRKEWLEAKCASEKAFKGDG